MPRFAAMCNVLFKCHRTLPWQTNKILIFLIFPVFSGFSSLFTFLHFSLILAVCISTFARNALNRFNSSSE
ncbi:hypothetical protein DW159_11680 [Coprococcus sp. AM14-16]|nr:hypothetical protein DW159_11680 [Coprococcus sp. AM14-16]